ncbi:prepilin-type N-terminal cleavage/methylation domain-containing protein [Lichenihabitans sp. Uapishka_5]|uniref:GspH/FimT family pseudopilin n=1 Tax=Lichenihabitans sp. Uapishka_5 TaxID=3037302 RepID=UPI0029E7EFE2|nr:GspH/FimT family pseudopilin [Lichenihabitans sp. Uapishka_5]MDX7951713.1 prepilin-type N-terminal cleavage/methylation domain-containing protein [Lichenihabitans sp. Uapishka_5]
MTGDRTAGFTLIEAIIVLGLMALGMALLGPMVRRGTSPRDLEAFGTRVAIEARRARTESMRLNVETALVFDAPGRAFLVRPGQGRLPVPHDVTATLVTSRSMDDGERPTIRFLPDGRSSGGEVRLSLPGATAVRIAVDWLTGWPRRVTP